MRLDGWIDDGVQVVLNRVEFRFLWLVMGGFLGVFEWVRNVIKVDVLKKKLVWGIEQDEWNRKEIKISDFLFFSEFVKILFDFIYQIF